MLPVATPPNTLVFSTGHLEVKDMVSFCVASYDVASKGLDQMSG